MKNSLFHRLTRREIYALILMLTLLIIGTFLGSYFEPVWLSRIGSIVIVVGVVFAISDLPMELERRALGISKVANALFIKSLIDRIENDEKRTLSKIEKDYLFNEYQKMSNMDDEFNASIPKKRFLIIEGMIICTGTIVNGFGEWLLCMYQH